MILTTLLMYIIAGRRLNKSITVKYDGPFKTNRFPHVQTTNIVVPGTRYELGARRTRVVGQNIAVMYDVHGLMDHAHISHFTAYFGPHQDASKY